ncbi:MAG: DUF4870 domain-containing protein [Chloroflexales bacterium]|nr:DUF4870 domain-containing protein [Chloroflexales bacterium]
MKRPTADERTLAALAHAGIITNGMNLLGLFGAALIWTTQRQRSAYVAGHALQALLFQGLVLLLVLLLSIIWGGCLLISLTPALIRPELYRTEPPATFWLALLMGLFILVFAVSAMFYGLCGAWAAWRGRPFHYILINHLIMMQQRQDDRELTPTTMITPLVSSIVAPHAVPSMPPAPPLKASPQPDSPEQEQAQAREA